MSDDFSRERYVETAVDVAVSGVRELAQIPGFELLNWSVYDGTEGTFLLMRIRSSRHPGKIVRYARVVLPSGGADKDAELSGMIYSTALEERLVTSDLQPPSSDSLDGDWIL